MEDTNKGQVDNPLSLNRYTYTHNNPLRYVDPSGHEAAPSYDFWKEEFKRDFKVISGGAKKGVEKGRGNPIITAIGVGLAILLEPRTAGEPTAPPLPNLQKDDERLKGKNIVYRALNRQDVVTVRNGSGIVAKNPFGNWDLVRHIYGDIMKEPDGTTSWQNDPFISTTEDLTIAMTRFNSGKGVVAIDLDKVTTQHYRAWERIPASDDEWYLDAYEAALYDREVTVEYYIPQTAIVGYMP